MQAFRGIDEWHVGHAAVAVVEPDQVAAVEGDSDHVFRLASVTKLLTAYATLVAVEEGSVDLDAPAGPTASTLRHLLAHAAGYPFDGDRPVTAPGRRRIYSNTGIEVAADHVAERTGIEFATYLAEGVLEPLGMTRTTLRGSPAAQAWGTVGDVVLFARELFAPTLLAQETLDEATRVQFPGLAGIVPGIGRQNPCDWGLGFEVRDHKSPHWTGRHNSPETYGHFGGSGTFLWLDPVAGCALACLTDREFGPWALHAWPRLSDAVLAERAPR